MVHRTGRNGPKLLAFGSGEKFHLNFKMKQQVSEIGKEEVNEEDETLKKMVWFVQNIFCSFSTDWVG